MFGKGKSGNPKGRPKGAKDTKKETVKAWIEQVINDNRDLIESDLRTLQPNARLKIVIKLLEFIVPKQSAVKAQIDFESLNEDELNEIVERITNDL